MHIIPEIGPTLLMVIPFIISFLGLWLILWKPLMQFLDDRENATAGARLEAEEFDRSAAERSAALELKLETVRIEIQDIHADARARALAKEADIVSAARAKADETLTEATARVADERLKAKAELETSARTLSTDIVDQLLARG